MSNFLMDTRSAGAAMPPRQQFSFPILKTEEIFKCLGELGITITLDELQHPEKVKHFGLKQFLFQINFLINIEP
jgi:hypothetical protein